jgi:hypothetical protein
VIKAVAKEVHARVAQHHDERHQQTARTADLEMTKMGPVDLCLFAGQRAQAQIRFGLGPRPMAGDQMAKVIRPAGGSRTLF